MTVDPVVAEIQAATAAERRALVTFVRNGTLEPSDVPGLTRAQRRALRKRCARWARAAGHRLDYRKPRERLKKRMDRALGL